MFTQEKEIKLRLEEIVQIFTGKYKELQEYFTKTESFKFAG